MHRNLLLNLLRAVYWYADAMHLNMALQGQPRMSRAASFLLLNIAEGEHRAINIARNLGISRQAVSQMLTDLCNRGFLESREDPDNRRSRIVDFSPAFANQGAACAEIMSKLDSEVSRRVGSDDFKAMRHALEFNWGALPRFARLNRNELRHGKEVWQEEFVAESMHSGPSLVMARQGAKSAASAARRAKLAHQSVSTSGTRKVTEPSDSRSHRAGRKSRRRS